MSVTNKKKYDHTSSTRSQRFSEAIRNAGGMVFLVRFYTQTEMDRLQYLISSGFGKNRNDVIRRLVEEKHAQLSAIVRPSGALVCADDDVASFALESLVTLPTETD